jgi:hypothetical protein
MDMLLTANHGHLSREQHLLLRSYEILFAGAMHHDACLLHRAGNHAGAKRALAAARKIQDATEEALV